MPLEFPSTAQLLETLVEIPTDVQTERGRKGFWEMHRKIQELVKTHGLGRYHLQELTDEQAGGEFESKLINIFIEVGDGDADEPFLLQAHGDTIVPEPFYEGTGENPLQCKQASDDPDIRTGCGCGDDKIGVVAMLRSLPELNRILANSRRRAIVLIDTAEEGQSQGIYAAKEHLNDIKWAATFDIPAGSKLEDSPCIIYGRPGRVVFEVTINAIRTDHLGTVTNSYDPEYIDYRMDMAKTAIRRIMLANHPDHSQIALSSSDHLPRSICIPHLSGLEDPLSMTMPTSGKIKIEVLYTNADLSHAEIEEEIRKAIAAALGDDKFEIGKQTGRVTPFIKPWIENPGHPLIQSAMQHLGEITGQTPRKIIGCPTANENVIANWGVPTVTLPPEAEGEHSASERTRLSYVDKVMVPWILAMAKSENSHVNWIQQ
ncbi:MAG: M20/M25/M40 family metallo-hydrolase [Candidatus Peribacteraceae bacterium]|jgi:acetylornithine deacetylase/succinyl-diaminopimelate desuccinylase-like protein|nr:M20/M25/M40 family metallo-hydrolase [Candidatus Peribacteraceae bacterium]